MKNKKTMCFFEADNGGGGGGGVDTGGGDPPSLIPPSGGQAPAPDATTPAEWISKDGTFSEKWTDKLPDDLKDAAPTLGKYRTVTEMAKALHNANGLIGKKTLVPNEKSTPEEIAVFRQAIGVPNDIKDYDIKPADLPQELGWNEDNSRRYAEIGHKHNIPPAAMKALIAEYASQRMTEMQLMAQEFDNRRTAGAEDLKKTWGENFDKNIAAAQQAAKLSGVPENSFGFGDPAVVKAFVRLASMLSDDKLVAGAGGASMHGGAARAKDISQNPANPLFSKYQSGDPDTVQMVRNFLQQG